LELTTVVVAVGQAVVLWTIGCSLRYGVDPCITEYTVIIEPVGRQRYFISIPLPAHNVASCLVVLDAEIADFSRYKMTVIGANNSIVILSAGSTERKRERFAVAVVLVCTLSTLNITRIAKVWVVVFQRFRSETGYKPGTLAEK